jgi:hypothetical protein
MIGSTLAANCTACALRATRMRLHGTALSRSRQRDHDARIEDYLQTGCPFTSAGVFPGGQLGLLGGGEGFAATGAAEGG